MASLPFALRFSTLENMTPINAVRGLIDLIYQCTGRSQDITPGDPDYVKNLLNKLEEVRASYKLQQYMWAEERFVEML
jgi:hypothetical protein